MPNPREKKMIMTCQGSMAAAPARSAPATKPKQGRPRIAVMMPNMKEPEGESALGLIM